MYYFIFVDIVFERFNMIYVVDLEWIMVMKKYSKIVNGFGLVVGFL